MSCNCNNIADIASLQDRLNTLESSLAPWLSGPGLLQFLTDSDQLALFDVNGNGTGAWTQWGFADGTVRQGYQTIDMRDRFPVGSGLSYNVGDTGGVNTVTLSTVEMPSHTHTPTDNGHTHSITDPGHAHIPTDAGHTHAASQVAHSHNGTTSTNGSHTHSTVSGGDIMSSTNGGDFVDNAGSSEITVNDSLASSGSHDHTVTTDSQTPAVTITAAFTGISIQTNDTGITDTDSAVTGIAIANTGGGGAHENRPPYIAGRWVQKVA